MNILEIVIVCLIIIFSLLIIVSIIWLRRKWLFLLQHSKNARFVSKAVAVIACIIIAPLIFWSAFKDDLIAFTKNIFEKSKTDHQKRIEFLETHCIKTDSGYEILNNNKVTYKCPNGKEYSE